MYSLVGQSDTIIISNSTDITRSIQFDFRMGESIRVESGDFVGVEILTGSPIAEDVVNALCLEPTEVTLVAAPPASNATTLFAPFTVTLPGVDLNATLCIKYGVQAIVVYDDTVEGEYSH